MRNSMKKRNKTQSKATLTSLTPLEALKFLEDMRVVMSDINEPTVAISIRVPQNVLRSIKAKAKLQGKKYQSLINEYIRKSLQNDV